MQTSMDKRHNTPGVMSFDYSLGGAAVSPYGPAVTGEHRTLCHNVNGRRQLMR